MPDLCNQRLANLRASSQRTPAKHFHSHRVTSDLALICKSRDHSAAETLGRAENAALHRR